MSEFREWNKKIIDEFRANEENSGCSRAEPCFFYILKGPEPAGTYQPVAVGAGSRKVRDHRV